ncbi:MAG TPA: hypothetical protein VF316_04130 [Polyangiaceae bacterium]
MPKYNTTAASERERVAAIVEVFALLDLAVDALVPVALAERAALEAIDQKRPRHEIRRARAVVDLARADADEAEALLLRAVAHWERLRCNARQWRATEAETQQNETSKDQAA